MICEVMKMPDYKKISTRLFIALTKISDLARMALDDAEESIVFNRVDPPMQYKSPSEEEN